MHWIKCKKGCTLADFLIKRHDEDIIPPGLIIKTKSPMSSYSFVKGSKKPQVYVIGDVDQYLSEGYDSLIDPSTIKVLAYIHPDSYLPKE